MARSPMLGLLSLCVLALAGPVTAQDDDRIWGRVYSSSGQVHEGFIRWGRNEASWVDILDGTKDVAEENYQVWLDANDGERAIHVVELQGYRVSWEEEHPDFARRAASGIRFGHLASLEVIGPGRAKLVLRSGQIVELERGGDDLGPRLRRLVVDAPGQREVRLIWGDLERVDFSAAPPAARAASRRLHGTVEDELGRTFTGYIAWDLSGILESDVLEGEEVSGGREHRMPFGTIAAIERTGRGARVVLADGRSLELTDNDDVDAGNAGIQVSDHALGMVELEWEAFRSVSFHEPDVVMGYAAFDGGRLLLGTVTTQAGEEIDGAIRWDADEAASWEFLNGQEEDVVFTIELSQVTRIERGKAFGALVTLVDGRSFELTDSNDVDWGNKGIMVAPEGADPSDASTWRMVPWDDFREIRFR